MKKNVIKMRVCLGFDCSPRLDAIAYEDDVMEGNKVYQSTKGVRNEKTLVELNQIWLKYDDNSRTPYWDAYVIVDADKADDKLYNDIGRQLYDTAYKAANESAMYFAKKAKLLEIPQDVHAIIQEKLNPSSSSSANGTISVSMNDFKRIIYDNAKSIGNELAAKCKVDIAKWNAFFTNTLTQDILNLLMKGLPVLKIRGDSIDFQNAELYEQAVNAVSGKVSNDVFARFMEQNK